MKRFFSLTMMLLITAVMAVQAQVNFSVKYKRVNATTIDIVFTGTAQPVGTFTLPILVRVVLPVHSLV